MRVLATLLITLLPLTTAPADTGSMHQMGFSPATTIVPSASEDCSQGELIVHHDFSFENAYAWRLTACMHPYFGAFGEGYDLGPGTVHCGAFWLTAHINPAALGDCYLWEGGVSGPPGTVIAMTPFVQFENVPAWPNVGQNEIELAAQVNGEVTVGVWGNWPMEFNGWDVAADIDGPPGNPWNCIAPGLGMPTGWQPVEDFFGYTASMGCGVRFTPEQSGVESPTWAAIERLMRCRPNPASSAARIEFELPSDGEVSLTIHDAGGRLLARLIDGPMPGGRHTVPWDGRDSVGRPVPAGSYFYRLNIDGIRTSERLQLVR